uniref:Uncharacterized protein n=1 Tax=Acrobeloides nanus TaxID=290746 RepID=A0A914BXZ6_9BILA
MACGFGVSINGFYASLLSIAPSYTGVLSSIHMVLGFLGMLATPQLVSVFRVYGTLEEWRTIFYIIASCVLVTGIFFCIFAEAEVQPWAKFDGSEKNSHNLLNEKESFNDLESWNVKEKTGVPS